MSAPSAGSQAAPHAHAVQFYEDEHFLIDVVLKFICEGFDVGEPAVIIATAPRLALVERQLETRGMSASRLVGEGRLILLEARGALSLFMSNALPLRGPFRDLISGHLEALRARNPQAARVRAYGEMVDVLFQDGNPQGALLLEEHWNDLGRAYPFTLLCGYALGNFRNEADSEAFHEVCRAHSHVAPAETYSGSGSEDARLREVSQLQQRARALETEITLRRRVEAHLLEALRVRDDFLSIAGHELKTPLTALQLQVNSLQVLARDLSSERLATNVARIHRQVARLTDLSEELLDVSRLAAGRLELDLDECDLSIVVADVVERSEEAISRSGCHVRMLAEEGAVGRWDRLRIEQVVTNLLSNALKYGGGKPVELLVSKTRERVRLEVRDHGIGIALTDQPRIFERFERAASFKNFGGLGLGLWIARQVVEAHGGVIHVTSELGAGATFVVELPGATPAG